MKNERIMDTDKIERIAGDVWRNSPLSIARHYGKIKINGKSYIIDRLTDDLVREDVYAAGVKKDKERRKAERQFWMDAQKKLFDP